jgi:segregation and condensation protein B
MNLEQKIEAILLFKNEPVSFKELSKILSTKVDDVRSAVENLQNFYKNRGLVITSDGETASFGTAPETSGLIEEMQKEEYSREIGRAGLETLSIILYKGPISRREIDYIRGVNSGFILRNLLIRGLIERSESEAGERSFSYKPTLELLRFLGVTRKEDLPEFSTAVEKIEEFQKAPQEDGQ